MEYELSNNWLWKLREQIKIPENKSSKNKFLIINDWCFGIKLLIKNKYNNYFQIN